MKVTRLPHDGRMIMGGLGVLMPFKPKPTNLPTTKSPEPEQPADPMQPAVDSMEDRLKNNLGKPTQLK